MASPAIRIVSTVTKFPSTYASQDQIVEALKVYWKKEHINVGRLETLHRSAQVQGRHLACPIDEYPTLDSFQKRNDKWIECATALGTEVASQAIQKAGLAPADIDHIFFVSITGIATPSIETRIAQRLGFRPNIKRSPLFGLGCVAGAAGIARAADYVRAFPGHRALLVSVELCSLTMQQSDVSVANIVATGLFGDGASAVVVESNSARDGAPAVLDSTAVLYPNSERVMGWDFIDSGFKIVLSSEVPDLARKYIGGDVDAFLSRHQLKRSDIKHWVIHTGGPKVLEAITASLELDAGALDRSWKSLRSVGNLSSSSVLHVLDSFHRDGVCHPGDYGILLAMGPGFCSEMSLLRW